MRDSHAEIIGVAEKARNRWEAHFAELFGGVLCENVPEAHHVFARCKERSTEEI